MAPKQVPLRWGEGGRIVGVCDVNDDGTFTAHDLDKDVRDLLLGDLTQFSVGYIPAKEAE